MRPRDGKNGSDHGAENGLEEGEGKGEGWRRNDGVRSKTNNGEEGEKGRVSRNNRSEERRSSGGILAFMKDTWPAAETR